ncbi:hypothetical protein Areg01_43300 [Actinoplanes regularis]|nr:hypothetical protein Areg01_43300 [Actinoplanes regularis]
MPAFARFVLVTSEAGKRRRQVFIEAFDRVHLGGTGIDRITEDEVVAVVRDALDHGRGGRIITPNVDILRRAASDPSARRHLDNADLIVADGMPLIWASRLGGVPLPERVAGSSLIWTLSQGLGRDARSVFVIGGTPEPQGRAALTGPPAQTSIVDVPQGAVVSGEIDGAAEGAVAAAVKVRAVDDASGAVRAVDDASGAVRAAARLATASPGLRIAGAISPPFGFEADEATYAEVCSQVIDAEPDLVFVGLGFPKQELVIERLRRHLPSTWFVGCGAAVNFVAGDVHRAPRWMQRSGLEWAHRLSVEPRRLARRYLREDAPYALRLLARAPRRFRRA